MDQIKIKKLFGNFDYNINLKKQGITILTGPNGYGKSTILNSINALRNHDLLYFHGLKFDSIEYIDNRSSQSLYIKRLSKNLFFDEIEINIEKTLSNFIKILRTERIISEVGNNRYRKRDDRKIYTAYELWNEIIIKDNNNEIYIDIQQSSNLLKPFLNKFYNTYKIIFDKIDKLCDEIYFIREQRLFYETHNEDRNIRYHLNEEDEELHNKNFYYSMEDLPKKFKSIIASKLNDYSNKSSSLDSSYPTRLFECSTNLETNSQILSKNLDKLKEKFENLEKYGISEIYLPQKLSIAQINLQKQALSVYIEDFNSKYNIFEPLIFKMKLFTDIINSRLNFKEIRLSRDKGIEIININNDEIIDLISLSSGEKQEIILFYELIFNTPENVLLLIDEPEISLHIIWQMQFMDDLMKITNLKKTSAIVATHSENIINTHFDLQIDLLEINTNEFYN